MRAKVRKKHSLIDNISVLIKNYSYQLRICDNAFSMFIENNKNLLNRNELRR